MCKIRLTAEYPVSGWVTEHLPIGTEIINHNGNLEIDTEQIEQGTIPHRFIFDDMTKLIITYETNRRVDTNNYYWVSYPPANFGWF